MRDLHIQILSNSQFAVPKGEGKNNENKDNNLQQTHRNRLINKYTGTSKHIYQQY